jgi:hypothetical protein
MDPNIDITPVDDRSERNIATLLPCRFLTRSSLRNHSRYHRRSYSDCSDSSEVVLPKAMMPPVYSTVPLNRPSRTKVRLRACRLVIALGAFVVLAGSAHAQTPVFIKDSVSSEEAGPSRIKAIKCWKEGANERGGATGCMAKIGDVVSLELVNLAGWLEKLKTDKVITSEQTGDALVVEQSPKLNLFVGEHLMKTLQPAGYTKDDPAWYTDPVQKKAALGRSWLEFILKREATNKVSRADWDPVLRTPGISPKMDLAVGIYDGNRNTAHVMALPVGAETTAPQLEFHFQRIYWDEWTVVGLILLMGAIVGFLYLLLRSGIVRDTTCAVREDGLPPLSLGRCQMAFWFFLVICAFYFLWLITGRGDTDTINSTILILIGISTGTALGSAIHDKHEATTTVDAKYNAAKAAYPNKIKDAKTALAHLKADRKNINPGDTGAITAKDAQIKEQASEVEGLKAELRDWRVAKRGQLLLDLLSEEDASADQGRVIAFHRFQIVVWTLILGVVFVSEVLTKLTMPVFDTTLLTLIGISSGTYLGFKVSH